MDNQFLKNSSEYSMNYVEYLTKAKADGKAVLKRSLIILLSLILFAGVIYLMFGRVKIPSIAVIAVVLIIYVAIVLWRFTSLEYEYVIVSGEMSMDVIYGAKTRKRLCEFVIRNAEVIAPFNGEIKEEYNSFIMAASSKNSPDAYYVIFKDEKGNKTALVFEMCDKAFDILKYYNRNIKSK